MEMSWQSCKCQSGLSEAGMSHIILNKYLVECTHIFSLRSWTMAEIANKLLGLKISSQEV